MINLRWIQVKFYKYSRKQKHLDEISFLPGEKKTIFPYTNHLKTSPTPLHFPGRIEQTTPLVPISGEITTRRGHVILCRNSLPRRTHTGIFKQKSTFFYPGISAPRKWKPNEQRDNFLRVPVYFLYYIYLRPHKKV